MNFDDFWKAFPTKTGDRGDKQRARMRFKRVVDAGRLETLLTALNAYCLALEEESWRSPMMCSTWLGSAADERWRVWAPSSDIEFIDLFEASMSAVPEKAHSCVLCEPPHLWKCGEPETCAAKFELACPSYAERFKR